MEFYAGVGNDKIRHELLGEKCKIPDFDQVIRRLQPIIQTRFVQLKKQTIKEIKKLTGKKTNKKREINRIAIKKMIENPKTPKQLKEYWENFLKNVK